MLDETIIEVAKILAGAFLGAAGGTVLERKRSGGSSSAGTPSLRNHDKELGVINTTISHNTERINRMEVAASERIHALRGEWSAARLNDAVVLAEFRGQISNNMQETKRIEVAMDRGFDSLSKKMDRMLEIQAQRRSTDRGDE